MLRVGIIGISGYTGAELARILSSHPDVEVTVATSRQYEGKPLADVYPHLRGCLDLRCENPSAGELEERADFFFTAVPHQTAMDIVPPLLRSGKKVVDLSADYRLRDQAVYEQWYQPHSSGELLGEAVYGLPELYRQRIKSCRLTANPGCYPTSVILALAPLLREKFIEPDSVIIDSKSGTSGAGRTAGLATLFCEVSDGFRPYKVGGTHRHIPEIEQELGVLAGKAMTISFTPHLLPVSRGILSTIYGKLSRDISLDALLGIYAAAYESEHFVRICPAGTVPATQHVRGSNFCDIGLSIDRRTGRVIVMSAIDNIGKGAAGQAVQNMNLMNGFAESAGLRGAPFFP